MSKWEMVRLGSINLYKSATINPLKEPNTEFELYSVPSYDCNYPEILTGAEIGSTKQIVNEGDILLCKINPRINRVWSVVRHTKHTLIASSEWIVIRNNEIWPNYLVWCLKSKPFRNLLTTNVTGIGGSLTRVQPKQVKEYLIPLPPYETQKHIANTLDKTQEIIDGHKKQLEDLDNLIKATFYKMFGDPVVNEKGWKTVILKDILLGIKYGTSTPPIFSEVGYKFIRATNIKNGRIFDEDIRYISKDEGAKIEKCKLNGNEMIIVRSGVNSGDTCIITKEYIGHYAGYDLILEYKNDRVLSEFVNGLFNTNYMVKVIKPLTRRAAQPHLNSEQVQSLQIILPPLELQKKYTSMVYKIEEQKAIVKQSIAESQNLYNSLMSKYFD